MSEIGDQEKIDIIVWASEPKEYIINALSPTKVSRVVLDTKTKKATVYVPEDQLSIAIGKNGQNVRLASKLTGYELDIDSDAGKVTEAPTTLVEDTEIDGKHVVESKVVTTKLKKKEQLESSLLDAINEQAE